MAAVMENEMYRNPFGEAVGEAGLVSVLSRGHRRQLGLEKYYAGREVEEDPP